MIRPLALVGAMMLGLLTGMAPASAASEGCAVPARASVVGSGRVGSVLAQPGGLKTLKIVAVGSSSTQGVGASRTAATYPAQLAAILRQRLPATRVQVVNKGVGGETVADNLRRFDRDVLREKPDLIIWQVGTNDALRGLAPEAVQAQIIAGIERARQQGATVVLMDPQPLPSPDGERAIVPMIAMIARVAKATGTPLFSRHERMLGWLTGGTLAANAIYSKDGLHMTDASYRCLALDVADMLAPAGEAVATAATVAAATATP